MPSAGVTDVCGQPQFLTQVLGSELRSPRLCTLSHLSPISQNVMVVIYRVHVGALLLSVPCSVFSGFLSWDYPCHSGGELLRMAAREVGSVTLGKRAPMILYL